MTLGSVKWRIVLHAAGATSRSAIVRLKVFGVPTAQGVRVPVSCSVPFPRTMWSKEMSAVLETESGAPIPIQVESLDLWSDGSIRWAYFDFLLPDNLDEGDARELVLAIVPRREPDAAAAQRSLHEDAAALRLAEEASGITVETGAARFRLARGTAFPFAEATARNASGSVPLLDPTLSRLEAIDDAGTSWIADIRELRIEHSGPLRATVLASGVFSRGRERPILELIARIHFYAGRSSVRAFVTVRNPRRAQHSGGHWELGDPGSILLRDLSLRLGHARFARVAWRAISGGDVHERSDAQIEIVQDSSGGERWQSRAHLDRERRIPTSFRGYRERFGGEERSGDRAEPWVSIHDGTAGIAIRPRWFWQNFPKAVHAGEGVLTFHLFPKHFASRHEIQGGEQKTHEMCLSFGREALHPETGLPADPIRAFPSPEWIEASEAIPYLMRRREGERSLHDRFVDAAIEGETAFERKREIVDEYGWRHFGEIWADHEAAFHKGEGEFISHHNNQYDPVYGAFLQFGRTGDARWFRMMEELARHVIDIDVYHTHEDKPAYNGGFFWHTVHYVDADLSTHRSYPRRGSSGGGPDNEHNYTTGLLHFHYLTGDRLAKDTVLSSADWVIDADDGALAILRRLDGGRTGLATKTRDFHYHGPGRGAGNSMNALLDAWRLTGSERYLEKVHEILHRVIHPQDEIARLRLLDSENRWSYTVFLQTLGKYLDSMAESGRVDREYAYARESLLAYAKWMAEHERPALDHPEELEYPTETWAAQDVRKADVFLFAALHSAGADRERFVDRARFFFRHSLETLDGFPTKHLARPVILLMHVGRMSAWWERHANETRPKGPELADFGPPAPFVPQKIRALRKLRRIAAIGAVVLVLAAIFVMRAARGG